MLICYFLPSLIEINTPYVAKLVSKAWKTLSEVERGKWDALAKPIKIRYKKEKLTYTGPWKVPVHVTTASQMVRRERGTGLLRSLKRRRPPQLCAGRRQQSHSNLERLLSLPPQAPPSTRPLSAFLAFSKNIKHQYQREQGWEPMGEIDMSPIVAQLWIDATPDKREIFVEEECQARQHYEKDLVTWKNKQQQKQQPGTEDTPEHHHQRDKHHNYGEYYKEDQEELARRTTAVDEILANNYRSVTKMTTLPLTNYTTDTSSSMSLATSIYSNDVAASLFVLIPSSTTKLSLY